MRESSRRVLGLFVKMCILLQYHACTAPTYLWKTCSAPTMPSGSLATGPSASCAFLISYGPGSAVRDFAVRLKSHFLSLGIPPTLLKPTRLSPSRRCAWSPLRARKRLLVSGFCRPTVSQSRAAGRLLSQLVGSAEGLHAQVWREMHHPNIVTLKAGK